MPIDLSCSHCGHGFTVDPAHSDQAVCPACLQPMTIASPAPADEPILADLIEGPKTPEQPAAANLPSLDESSSPLPADSQDPLPSREIVRRNRDHEARERGEFDDRPRRRRREADDDNRPSRRRDEDYIDRGDSTKTLIIALGGGGVVLAGLFGMLIYLQFDRKRDQDNVAQQNNGQPDGGGPNERPGPKAGMPKTPILKQTKEPHPGIPMPVETRPAVKIPPKKKPPIEIPPIVKQPDPETLPDPRALPPPPLPGEIGGITLADAGQMLAMRYSPDGTTLAVGTSKGHAYWIDVKTREVVASGKWASFEDKDDGILTSSAISPDTNQIAFAWAAGKIRVADRKRLSEPIQLANSDFARRGQRQIVFSPDGLRLCTVHEDSKARIWNVQSGAIESTIEGYKHFLHDVVYSADGALLAFSDHILRIHDTSNGENLTELRGSTDNGMFRIAFSPKGTIVASAQFRTINLWSYEITSEGKIKDPLRREIRILGTANELAFSPDGSLLLAASEITGVSIFEVATHRQRNRIDVNDSRAAAFRMEDGLLALADGDRVRLLDLKIPGGKPVPLRKKEVVIKDGPPRPKEVVIKDNPPRSKSELLGPPREVAPPSKKYAPLDPINLAGLTGEADAIRFSPDGKKLTVALHYEGVAWIDLETGQIEAARYKRLEKIVTTGCAISPQGDKVAFCWHNGLVYYVERASPEKAIVLHDKTPNAIGFAQVAFSPDGRYLAAAQKTGQTRIWDLTQRELGQTVLAPTDKSEGGHGLSVAYAPDGKLLATASTGLTIYDTNEFGKVFQFKDNVRDAFRQLEFAPDGQSLVGSNGLSFSVWDLKREDRQIVLARPARSVKVESFVRYVGFSPDGRCILVGLSRGAYTLYDRESLKPLPEFPQPKCVGAFAYRPSDGLLAVGQGNQIVFIEAKKPQTKP
jgi:WD40 repeat protein